MKSDLERQSRMMTRNHDRPLVFYDYDHEPLAWYIG